MRMYEFQNWVKIGWARPQDTPEGKVKELAIMCMGLPGEVGEVLELIKKETRGDGPLDKVQLQLEIGDVLHYLCRIASQYDLDMENVMYANCAKIEARRGKRSWETT